jgi:hypothetical protein
MVARLSAHRWPTLYLNAASFRMSRTRKQVLARIKAAYRPYDALPEFQEGFDAYMLDGAHRRCLYDDGVKAQAFDRGASTAMLFQRALDHVDRVTRTGEQPKPGWLASLIHGRRP